MRGEIRKCSDILVRESCSETSSCVRGCHARWSPQKQPSPRTWSRQGGWNREATPICLERSNLDKLPELSKPCGSRRKTGQGAPLINSFTALSRRAGRCKHSRSSSNFPPSYPVPKPQAISGILFLISLSWTPCLDQTCPERQQDPLEWAQDLETEKRTLVFPLLLNNLVNLVKY